MKIKVVISPGNKVLAETECTNGQDVVLALDVRKLAQAVFMEMPHVLRRKGLGT